MKRVIFILALLSSGCGKLIPTSTVASVPQAAVVDGHTLVKFGFGAEGGATPAVAHTADGWVAVYAGSRLGDRQLYSAHSSDGTHWDKPKKLGQSGLTDQYPCLTTDNAGNLHLFFASNRDGDDFQLYHAQYSAGTFRDATAIANTSGASDCAVSYCNGQFVLAAETMGVGLQIKTSPDGESFTGDELLTEQGFEPAITALSGDQLMVAYTRSGRLYASTGKPGKWNAETLVTKSSTKLQEPTLAMQGTHGLLAWAERGASPKISARRFDASGKFESVPYTLPSVPGESRSPGLCVGEDGEFGLIWGMKDNNGQQGIIFSVLAAE